ncbi:S8/S53 family peptidase [Gimibacter soli]|uniref:S8/S53 family peptidase n=1 Tax=Gimibacter soli TaxID=3024400 RepID=A0AAE9XSZ4_9PROT|nr:S8/S53 family peptidase [Gimibacter soli]WCL54411.1 S8/S53 family peptidase [Gimibacter soli]
MTKNKKLALLAATCLSAASPGAAHASEIKIGLLDTEISTSLDDRPNLSIILGPKAPDRPGYHRASYPIADAMISHGDLMVHGIIDGVDRTLGSGGAIMIFHANPFLEKDGSGGKLAVDWRAAHEALSWYHENGVKVVVTSFVNEKTAATEHFMKTAEELGLQIITSTGNKRADFAPWPASHHAAISVAGTNKGLRVNYDSVLEGIVDLVIDGEPAINFSRTGFGKKDATSSSYATARAGGMIAALVCTFDLEGREEIMEVLHGHTEPRQFGKFTYDFLDFDALSPGVWAAYQMAVKLGDGGGGLSPGM